MKRLSPADKALIAEAHERALAVMEVVEQETDTKFLDKEVEPRGDYKTMLAVVKMIHRDFSYVDDCACSSMARFNRAYEALVEAGVVN